jgi:diaminopimelate decarboxylase
MGLSEKEVSDGFRRFGGVLSCGGVSLEAVAEEFGTPLYVYDMRGIEDRVRRFQRAFRAADVLVAYSVKANGSLALLNRIGALGAGADIVSLGELQRALRAGIPADRIVFAGVGKTEEEMIAGLESGIRAFHVESRDELDLLSEVAGRMEVVAPVGLRVNPDVSSPTSHEYVRTGHAASKFGIPVNEAEALYQARADDRRIAFKGIDVHIGSQIPDIPPFVHALDTVLGMFDRLTEAGVSLGYVDLGGGFGVEYQGEAGLDPEDLADEVLPRLRQRGLRLIVEPGRSIVGESGVLLAKVLYVKRASGKTFVVTDGGMTELLRPSHYGGFHGIAPVRAREGAPTVTADVVGPVCESGDFLARDREVSLPEPGDFLAVKTAGAYGFAMASNYNARRRPAEVMIENGEAVLIRHREALEDLWRGEEIPPRPRAEERSATERVDEEDTADDG